MNNFIDFGHALGRSEMKKLMAGSEGSGDVCYCSCPDGSGGRLGGYGCSTDSWCTTQCKTYYSCSGVSGECACC